MATATMARALIECLVEASSHWLQSGVDYETLIIGFGDEDDVEDDYGDGEGTYSVFS